ncbi:MAG: putative esterase/lipase [Candidatus Saccharibacteria bacterium]|nr:putative esterase/lipase [Candidatus Saccharibacteria bacterium]MDB5181185.1 putative esterase/lipase [Candidatus Saccharibacteria bacterium]
MKVSRGLKVLLIITGLIIVIVLAALLWLSLSVNKYSAYWVEKSKDTGEITYLALGDSAAQGIGATNPFKGYVGLIAKNIENKNGKSVRIVNISKTGAKMDDYLKDQAPVIATLKPDIITIEIGANDIADFDATAFRSKFKKVLQTLPDGSFVSNMPLFNSRPGSTENGKQASAIVEEELHQYPNLKFVDLQKETQENQSVFGFAPDLFHPNNLSYKNWANAFLKKINN